MTADILSVPTNLDFEQGHIGEAPTGWASPSQSQHYTVQLTEQRPRSGRFCAVIEKLDSKVQSQDAFGNMVQAIDAEPYRGKLLRFTGWARIGRSFLKLFSQPAGYARAWLRVDRAQGNIGFFDNMQDRPITSKNWQPFEIVGNVAEDAESIYFGLMLHGGGKAWLDDLSLEVIGDATQAYQVANVLSDRGLENLVALTRLIGYVRYFHPTKSVRDTDWNLFTIAAVRKIETVQSKDELIRTLANVFRSVAPSVEIRSVDEIEARSASKNELSSKRKARFWKHRGVGLGGMYAYSSNLLSSKNPPVGVDVPIISEIGCDVSALIPTAIAHERRESFEGTPFTRLSDEEFPPYWIPSGNDRSTRLAGISLAWNVFQHFYPYFEFVDDDWHETLRRSLADAAVDENENDFVHTLNRLIAKLRDGHGRVFFRSPSFIPAIALAWVDDNLVITTVGDGIHDRLQPGHLVTAIDDRPTADILQSVSETISAATPWFLRYRATTELLAGSAGSSTIITVQTQAGERESFTLQRDTPVSDPILEQRPEQGSELADEVIYVDLDRMGDLAEFTVQEPKLIKAKGIVFDVRGYPEFSSSLRVISHLIDETVTSAQWHVPVVHHPNRLNMGFEFSNWKVRPKSPRYTKNVAIVTDERAISAAETILGIFEHYRLAEIVGGPTAGTNGNVNPFVLPGGFHVTWTGMKVLKHDGSRHHGVGIQPTVPVSRTIAGIAEGRDELLEKAVDVVKSKIDGA